MWTDEEEGNGRCEGKEWRSQRRWAIGRAGVELWTRVAHFQMALSRNTTFDDRAMQTNYAYIDTCSINHLPEY
jgi:hypothetical protein